MLFFKNKIEVEIDVMAILDVDVVHLTFETQFRYIFTDGYFFSQVVIFIDRIRFEWADIISLIPFYLIRQPAL